MIEERPLFWSKRFRHVLLLAIRGDPRGTVAGLYWYATRRRVRGWSRLLACAAMAKPAYRTWVAYSEGRAFDRFRERHRESAPVSPEIVLISDKEVRSLSLHDIQTLTVGQTRLTAVRQTSEFDAAPVLPRAIGPALEAIAARSEWVLPVIDRDMLSDEVLDAVQRQVAKTPDANLIYWDEDVIEEHRRSDPWIKPSWDDLLFSRRGGLAGASMVSTAVARDAAKEAPGLSFNRENLEHLLFNVARSDPQRIANIPLVLTHRARASAISLAPAGVSAPAQFQDPTVLPSVSIIVPTRDRSDLLAACMKGIRSTTYPGSVELIIVDNGTVEPEALRIIEERRESGAKVLRDAGPFNFSRLNNSAVKVSGSEFLCFYNNDVEPLDTQWLTRMMIHAAVEGTGAVGALLLYPSGRIQHAGVVVGMGNAAGHVQKGVWPDEPRHRTWHAVTREVSAVTGAVMIVRKRDFDAAGGFDEEAFPVAFNDVDLCLRLKRAGLRNVYVAEARLLHRESESRGDDHRPERAAKFAAELGALQSRWATEGFDDPHFSPLFLRSAERCILAP